MSGLPTAPAMECANRRRSNSAPGYLHQQHSSVSINSYHVGIYNQFLPGGSTAGIQHVQQQPMPLGLSQDPPGYLAPNPGFTTHCPPYIPPESMVVEQSTPVVETTEQALGVSEASGSYKFGISDANQGYQTKYQATSTGSTSSFPQWSDWNSTHPTPAPATTCTFTPIPSPIPWGICAEGSMMNSSPNAGPGIENMETTSSDGGTVPLYPGMSFRAKPELRRSMYPNADQLSQHYLMLLQQVFPEHTTSALQHILDRCGGDIINALENILACHAYRERLLKTCMAVLNYPPPLTTQSQPHTQPEETSAASQSLAGFTSMSSSDDETLDAHTSAADSSPKIDNLWSPESAQLLTPSDLDQLQDFNQSDGRITHEFNQS